MGAQESPLPAGQPVVERAGNRELGLVAGQGALELLPQSLAGLEEQRLDAGCREGQDVRDFRIGSALHLAHHQYGTLVEREASERSPDVRRSGELLFDEEIGLDEALVPAAQAANLVRDREQRVQPRPRPASASEVAIRVEESRVRDLLGIRGIPENRKCVVVHVADVRPVDALEGSLLPREQGAHAGDDAEKS